MKKILALVLAAVMALSLTACQAASADAAAAAAPAAAEAAAPAAAEAAPAAKAEAAAPAAAEAAPAAAEAAPAAGETFKIGWYSPLSGANATQGTAAHNSVELYIKELNERGGLLGMPVELVDYDDASDTEEAVKIATKLVEVDKVDFVISSIISNCVLASGQIFEDAHIPFFGMGFSPTFMQQG